MRPDSRSTPKWHGQRPKGGSPFTDLGCNGPITHSSEVPKMKRTKQGAGLEITDRTWRGKRLLNIGTWNIRSITGKEKELVDEFEKSKLDILAITETKKKNKGVEKVENNHVLVFSGVGAGTRAQAGVALLIHKKLENNISSWKFVSQRILTVTFKFTKSNLTNIIVVYGVNEDTRKEEKDTFWEELQKVIDDVEGEPLLLGDFNARVGKDPNTCAGVIGKHGEEIMNDNGERLTEFCVANDLRVVNTMFPRKEIHKFTREEPSRNEKSIIDYFLVPREEMKTVMDCRVHQGYEIGSDHYLLKMRKEIREEKKSKKKEMANEFKVNIYKLRQEETKLQFREALEVKALPLMQEIEGKSLEEKWKAFKTALLDTAKIVCGESRVGTLRKVTSWWNDEIKEEIKRKKVLWKKYLCTKKIEDYEEYKEQRKRAKELVKAAKEESWEDFGRKMEENHTENQKLFYKTLKNMRKEKPCPLKHIKDKEGTILNSDEEIMKRWKEYFEDLLNCEQGETEEPEDAAVGERAQQEEGPEYITDVELQDAIKKLRNGKAAGHDFVYPEMLKSMGPRASSLFLDILNCAWTNKSVPEDWRIAVIIPIFKKGDNRECSNHRGISLLSVAGKVYSRILESRLRRQVEGQIEEFQSGFRPNRCTQDLIFTMRILSEKMVEKGKEFHAGFIDLSQAFDKVPSKEIWKVLAKLQVKNELNEAIKSLYNHCKNYVRTGNKKSAEFVTRQGVRQGDNLSPLLFILLLDEVMKNVKTKVKNLVVGNYQLRAVKICSLAFADDIVVLGKNEESLQHNMNIWADELTKKGMKINANKTQTMAICGKKINHQILVGNSLLKQVPTFKYLGSVISESGKIEEEINERIAAASRLFWCIRNKFLAKREISKKTKLAVYKSTFVPTLTYGCESWTLTKRLKSKLQAMEMRYLRKIENKTRRDRIRNVAIRNTLDIKPLTTTIQEQQLKWFGHVHRMPTTRLPKMIKEVKVEGKCKRGRPRRKWEEEIEDALRERGSSTREALPLTADRKSWRRLATSTPTGRRGQD